jgi:hypothetical protein
MWGTVLQSACSCTEGVCCAMIMRIAAVMHNLSCLRLVGQMLDMLHVLPIGAQVFVVQTHVGI